MVSEAFAHRFNKVIYVRNYDGDTVTINIPSVHPLLGSEIGLRIEGIDTPEIRGSNQCEKDKAKEAKAFVENMIKKGSKLMVRDAKRGKYFRIVGELVVDGKSVGEALLKAGLAVPYDGGTKPKVDWCAL